MKNLQTPIPTRDVKTFKVFALSAQSRGIPLGFIQGHLMMYLAAQDAMADGVQLFESPFVASHFGPMVAGVGHWIVNHTDVTAEDRLCAATVLRYAEKYLHLSLAELKKLAYEFAGSPWEVAYDNGKGVDTPISPRNKAA